MKIALSVGHGTGKYGAYDPGAVAKEGDNEYHEFKIAREIAKYCEEELKKYNCIVELINYNGAMYLYDRIQYINRKKFNCAIEFHLNAGHGTGTECYYARNEEHEEDLAALITKNLYINMGLRNRGAKTRPISEMNKNDYFGFVREIPGMSLLLENAFIDTKADRDKLITEAGQRKQGRVIAASIVAFYGLKRKSQTKPEPKPASPANDELIRIQCGAYKNKSGAETLAAELKKRGFSTYLVNVDGLWKVQVGAYSEPENAKFMEKKIKEAGYKCFIVYPDEPAKKPSKPKAPAFTAEDVGKRIKVKKTAKEFTNGVEMASFVPGGIFYIRKVEKSGKILLISPKKTGAYTGRIYATDAERV